MAGGLTLAPVVAAAVLRVGDAAGATGPLGAHPGGRGRRPADVRDQALGQTGSRGPLAAVMVLARASDTIGSVRTR